MVPCIGLSLSGKLKINKELEAKAERGKPGIAGDIRSLSGPWHLQARNPQYATCVNLKGADNNSVLHSYTHNYHPLNPSTLMSYLTPQMSPTYHSVHTIANALAWPLNHRSLWATLFRTLLPYSAITAVPQASRMRGPELDSSTWARGEE